MQGLEVALTALVGVAGILGTLAASDRAHRSALTLARTARGKDAAAAALDALGAMTDLLSGAAVTARRDELESLGMGREAPDYILAPSREEMQPHIEAMRRQLIAVPDRAVRTLTEQLAHVLMQGDDVIQYSSGLTLSALREGVRSAAADVIGAYLRDEPIPAADTLVILQTATAALAQYEEHVNWTYELYLKSRPRGEADADAAP